MGSAWSRLHKYAIWALFFFFFLFQAAANADHLPDELLADGNPETTLAGIDLRSAKMSDVVRMYGPPTRETKAPKNPAWTGYAWELPNAKLSLGVYRDASSEQIDDIYVEGTSSGQVGATGSGLRLGDTIKELRLIYGSNYELTHLRNKPGSRNEFTGISVANQRVDIQWRLEDFTLSVGIDSNGKVIAMWLMLPECYPEGCE